MKKFIYISTHTNTLVITMRCCKQEDNRDFVLQSHAICSTKTNGRKERHAVVNAIMSWIIFFLLQNTKFGPKFTTLFFSQCHNDFIHSSYSSRDRNRVHWMHTEIHRNKCFAHILQSPSRHFQHNTSKQWIYLLETEKNDAFHFTYLFSILFAVQDFDFQICKYVLIAARGPFSWFFFYKMLIFILCRNEAQKKFLYVDTTHNTDMKWMRKFLIRLKDLSTFGFSLSFYFWALSHWKQKWVDFPESK